MITIEFIVEGKVCHKARLPDTPELRGLLSRKAKVSDQTLTQEEDEDMAYFDADPPASDSSNKRSKTKKRDKRETKTKGIKKARKKTSSEHLSNQTESEHDYGDEVAVAPVAPP
jgi:hypothetical protein